MENKIARVFNCSVETHNYQDLIFEEVEVINENLDGSGEWVLVKFKDNPYIVNDADIDYDYISEPKVEVRNINLYELTGQMFRHFKGDLYLLINIAIDSNTGRKIVIYKALYGSCDWYTRDMEEFLSLVDTEKHPNVEQKYRFELVNINSVKED